MNRIILLLFLFISPTLRGQDTTLLAHFCKVCGYNYSINNSASFAKARQFGNRSIQCITSIGDSVPSTRDRMTEKYLLRQPHFNRSSESSGVSTQSLSGLAGKDGGNEVKKF